MCKGALTDASDCKHRRSFLLHSGHRGRPDRRGPEGNVGQIITRCLKCHQCLADVFNFWSPIWKPLTAVHVRGLQERKNGSSECWQEDDERHTEEVWGGVGGERWRWTLRGCVCVKLPGFLVGLLAILQTESRFLTAGAQQDVEMADTRLCISTSAGLKTMDELVISSRPSLFLLNNMKRIKRCKQPDTATRGWSRPISVSCTVAPSRLSYTPHPPTSNKALLSWVSQQRCI